MPAATGAANANLAAACNGGAPMYQVRWYSYTPSATTSIVARGETYLSYGRDAYAEPTGVAILAADQGVIDCNVVSGGWGDSSQVYAVAGPVKVTANTKVYVVQFSRSTSEYTSCEGWPCYDFGQLISVRSAAYPIPDDWYNAEPITSIPATRTVDTTLSTQDPPNDTRVLCGLGTVGVAFQTLWWTLTPTTTGRISASTNRDSGPVYRVAFGEATAGGVQPVNDCEENPILQAGRTYLMAVGISEDYYSDSAGSGGPVTLTIDSGPELGRPDLVVSKVVSSPVSPKAGDPVTFRATIKNQGTAPTQGGVVHGVSFKVDGVAKTWSDTFNRSLAPGQSVTVSSNGGVAGAATWPATVGSHTVLATVDDVNRIPGEVSESNNTRSVPLSVVASPARPDLVVTGVSWTPSAPGTGAAVTFKATIKNQGTAATPADVVHGVVFKVDGVARTWSDTSTGSLAVGASRTVTANGGTAGKATWPGTTGQHTVQAVVDDINRIKTESDETNNALLVPLNIGAIGSRPDLVVTGVSWSPSSAGSPVRFSATVKNVGTRSTPEGKVVGVSFRPNGQTAGATYSDTFSSHIPPGATVTLTANGGGTSGTWTTPAGSTPVVAIVDDLNRIPEANEANNTLTVAVTAD